MKNILTAAAISLMASTAAFADGHTTINTYTTDAMTGDFSASGLIGMRVYSAETEYDSFNADTAIAAGAEREWDDIGEINDIILNRDGSVKAVVLGVGGFIGIGEKDVALPMDALKMVNEQDDPGDFFVVVKTNKEALEAAPEYDDPEEVAEDAAAAVENAADATAETAGDAAETVVVETEQAGDAVVEETAEAAEATEEATETAAAEVTEETAEAAETTEQVVENTAEATTETTTDNTTTVVVTEGERPMLVRPEVEREGYTMATMDQLTTEDLTGARVYGAADEDVGEINELLVDDSGKIEAAVLGIGGFIGIGERDIRVTMDELNIMRSEDGDVRVYIDATKENLEAQPAYEG